MVYSVSTKIRDEEEPPPHSMGVIEPKKVKTTFDDILILYLGNFGMYQFIQFILLCFPTIFVAMHVMSWAFVAAPPNITPVSCTNGTFCHTERQDYSAILRWDMTGKRSWIKATVQSLYYLGQMTGSLFCGIAGDKLGRKKVFYLALLIQTSCGLLLSIAPTWWIFAILKAGTGFSQPGIYGVAIVLGMELVGAKYRRLGAVIAGAFYAVGEILLAILAYFIVDYRVLHAAIALPSLLFLSYWWICDESTRWLLSVGRYEEANKILVRAAKINKSYIPSKWWDTIENNAVTNKDSSFGIYDLVRTPQMRKRTLVCFFLWPVCTMLYYGMTMKSDIGGGSLFVNFAMSAAMEIPSLFLVYFLIDRIGRRMLVSCGLLTAGLCLVANWIIGDKISFYVGLFQMMITKGAITVSYTAMYTYTSELFPTVIRNSAVGCCSTIARIGAISSSYIALWLVDSYGKLAMVIPFCVLSLIAAILTQFLLPETNGKPMPESISEVEGTNI